MSIFQKVFDFIKRIFGFFKYGRANVYKGPEINNKKIHKITKSKNLAESVSKGGVIYANPIYTPPRHTIASTAQQKRAARKRRNLRMNKSA